MNFQRILLLFVVLLAAGLAGSFYMNWKTLGQLRTVKAFVEGSVFADAVAACEKAPSTTPFKWTGGKQTAVIGLTSVKLNKDTIFPSYTLVADSVFCDYDPVKKKADIGSNFLERETFLDSILQGWRISKWRRKRPPASSICTSARRRTGSRVAPAPGYLKSHGSTGFARCCRLLRRSSISGADLQRQWPAI